MASSKLTSIWLRSHDPKPSQFGKTTGRRFEYSYELSAAGIPTAVSDGRRSQREWNVVTSRQNGLVLPAKPAMGVHSIASHLFIWT